MANEKKDVEKGEPIVEVYRVLKPVVLVTDRNLYLPGAIVDLSHLPDASIQYFLDRGFYETAEGEPQNIPQPLTGDNTGRKARPCCR